MRPLQKVEFSYASIIQTAYAYLKKINAFWKYTDLKKR